MGTNNTLVQANIHPSYPNLYILNNDNRFSVDISHLMVYLPTSEGFCRLRLCNAVDILTARIVQCCALFCFLISRNLISGGADETSSSIRNLIF